MQNLAENKAKKIDQKINQLIIQTLETNIQKLDTPDKNHNDCVSNQIMTRNMNKPTPTPS